MFAMIGSVIKYSVLVVVILVLSHIVEVKGVSVSQHVLNGMHWVSGYHPSVQANRITADFSKTMQNRVKELDKIGDSTNEVTPTDQQALNKVIENSQFKK
jgi:hypothetical protein